MFRYLPVLLLVLPAGAAAAAPEVTSWGKKGVQYDQYRRDAVDCATTGYFRDVSQDAPAKRFLRGFRSASDALNGNDIGGPGVDRWRDAILRTQPDRQKRDLHRIQVGDVESCLTDRGYTRFTLTGDEARQLSRYPAGSDVRRRYLHRLAARR